MLDFCPPSPLSLQLNCKVMLKNIFPNNSQCGENFVTLQFKQLILIMTNKYEENITAIHRNFFNKNSFPVFDNGSPNFQIGRKEVRYE